MTRTQWALAIPFIMVAASASAAILQPVTGGLSPADGAGARYCLRVAPATGSMVETVQCWTRAKWDAQGVDVDKEWAREGVAMKP